MPNYLSILGIIALIVSLLLLIKFYRNLFVNFNGYLLVLLGYTVFIFFDIFRYSIIEYNVKILRENTIVLITLYTILSLIIFLIVYHSITFKRIKKQNKINEYSFLRHRFDKIVLPFSIIYIIVYVFILDEYNNNYFLLFSYISKSTLILCFYFYFKTKENKYLLYFFILTSISFFESSRRIYIVVFVILMIIYLISNAKSINNKLAIKTSFIIISILFFIFLNSLRSTHDFGKGYEADKPLINTFSYIKDLRIADTFYNAGFIYETFPNRFDYYYGISYTSPIFGLIPRSYWADKPTGFAADLGFMQRTNFPLQHIDDWKEINMFSLSPGFIGEALANFGVFGILLLPILVGIFTKFIDTKNYAKEFWHKPEHIPNLVIYPALFLIFRGDFYSALVFSIYLYIFLKLTCLFIFKKKNA